MSFETTIRRASFFAIAAVAVLTLHQVAMADGANEVTFVTAEEAEPRFYVGAGYVHLFAANNEFDTDVGAAQVLAGYRPDGLLGLGVEGSVFTGVLDGDGEFNSWELPTASELDLSWGVAATHRMGLGTQGNLSVISRVGYTDLDVDTVESLNWVDTVDGGALTFGGGVEAMVLKNTGLRFDYTKYVLEGADRSDSFGISAIQKF